MWENQGGMRRVARAKNKTTVKTSKERFFCQILGDVPFLDRSEASAVVAFACRGPETTLAPHTASRVCRDERTAHRRGTTPDILRSARAFPHGEAPPLSA